MPVLSLILCSRNDSYMGNSRWRLETTLNYVAGRLAEMERLEDAEVLVADWGSEVPLRQVLRLTPAAARLVKFVHIPPVKASEFQKDSPFPEVLALNTVARRARGEFIGRIDQDTLVGKRFLEVFFDLHEGKIQLEVPFHSALLFSNLRMVPYRFAVRCPSLPVVERFVTQSANRFKVEVTTSRPFWCHGVGIWLMPSAIWEECGGYNEEMLYMNSMEIEMILRLLKKYEIIDLGKIINFDFYHLEHYHPWLPRMSRTHRKVNKLDWETDKLPFNPSGSGWGLPQYSFSVEHGNPTKESASNKGANTFTAPLWFTLLRLVVGLQMALDVVAVQTIIFKQRFVDSGGPKLRPGVPK